MLKRGPGLTVWQCRSHHFELFHRCWTGPKDRVHPTTRSPENQATESIFAKLNREPASRQHRNRQTDYPVAGKSAPWYLHRKRRLVGRRRRVQRSESIWEDIPVMFSFASRKKVQRGNHRSRCRLYSKPTRLRPRKNPHSARGTDGCPAAIS
jgi:hypothetical protein